ncbi:MAG: hypothetical protein WDO13_21755 [Verrucomicrobiota bacterium]
MQTFKLARTAVFAAALTTAGLAGAALAQDAVTTTTSTTSAGTVSEFAPGVITVRSDTGVPVSYSYSHTTTYVDENGNPVSTEVVRSGVPVTVYYTQDGDRMVASKVVVRRSVPAEGTTIIKKTTTTTTSPAE